MAAGSVRLVGAKAPVEFDLWRGAEAPLFHQSYAVLKRALPPKIKNKVKGSGQGCPLHTNFALAVVVAAAEVIDEHLFDGLVVGHKDVADGVSADEVANFFGKILGVVSGALQRLRHENDLQAGLAVNVFGILDVAQEDEIAQAIHFSVGAEDVDGLGDFAQGKGRAAVGEHFFEDGRHLGQVAGVLGIDAVSSGLGAVGEAEEKIADAFKADHELHAGQKFAGLGRADFGDGSGNAGVDFHIERIEFALALAQRSEQGGGAGGDALGRSPRGFLGETTGFYGAAHDVVVSRFRVGALDRGAHEDIRRARTQGTLDRRCAAFLPFVGWDGQQLSIGFIVKGVVNNL